MEINADAIYQKLVSLDEALKKMESFTNLIESINIVASIKSGQSLPRIPNVNKRVIISMTIIPEDNTAQPIVLGNT